MLKWKRSRPDVEPMIPASMRCDEPVGPRRFATTVIVGVACVIALAACGGDGGSKSGDAKSSTTTTRVDVRSAERGCQKAAAEAQHPGDNKDCDSLADACGDHNWTACDRLFQVSDFGSEYESIGGSCAGSITLDERLASVAQPGTQDPRIANEYCEQVVKPRVEAFLGAVTTTTVPGSTATTSD